MGLEIYGGLPIHRAMLADEVRNDAYRRAIEAAVRPDSVVLDVGAGTGVLAGYAIAAGARRVYAIERSPIAALARRAARRHGGRMQVIQADVAAAELPGPVDLVVSEWMGAFGIDENLLGMVLLARDRWLRPGGCVLPGRVAALAAPVEGAAARSSTLPGTRSAVGRPMRWAAAGLPGAAQLAIGQALWTTDLATCAARAAALPFRGRLRWLATRAGVMDGIVAWFVADLGSGVTLGNAPGAPQTHWGQFVFAVDPPLPVQAGTIVEAAVTTIPAVPGYCHHAWSVRAGNRPWQHHDTRGAAV